MALTQEQKKQFKSIGHHLKPILIVGDGGLTEGFMAELDRALNDHELIKVKINLSERDDRQAVIGELCETAHCELAQSIGKMALIYRKSARPTKGLSNVERNAPEEVPLMSRPAKRPGLRKSPIRKPVARKPGIGK